MDLGWIGNQFKWANHQEGKAFIKEMLDRFLTNREWLEYYARASVDHLSSELSNHAPIMLNTSEGEVKKGRILFRFLEAWITDNSSSATVEKAWFNSVRGGMKAHKVQRQLQATVKALSEWNRSHFGIVQERIKKLENDLERMQFGQGEKLLLQVVIEEELRGQRARHESIWRQKSHVLWLEKGDRNSHFFHASVINRQRRNHISVIYDEGEWIRRTEDINKYFLEKFEEVYKYDNSALPTCLESLDFQPITQEANGDLMKIPSEAEIKASITALHPLKAPGPERFSGIFYRHYWETVNDQVVLCTQECFRNGVIPNGLNRSFIVLILKSQQATEFDHFRPIS